jgi:dienelactone hydrolase
MHARLPLLVFVACALAFRTTAHAASAAGVAWEPRLLPVSIDGATVRLDTILAYPDDGARHPLVVLGNGSPRDAADRPRLRPTANAEQILWFVRHGFAVASILRRGYGRSEGGWAEGYGPCDDPAYAQAGLRGAADVAATMRALRDDPHVDATRVVAAGVSAGAFATVALTSEAPPGLVAAIAFAPGRGSYASGKVCAPDRLVSAFATYGATSRVPLLWISAANDHFFDPALVARLVAAFERGGGHATFVAAPADGDEGHYLFSNANAIPVWAPSATAFLVRNGFAFASTELDLRSAIAAPAALGPNGRAAFARYLLEPPSKAFAVSSRGRYAYAYGSRSDDEATRRARASCERGDAGACTVVNVNGHATSSR